MHRFSALVVCLLAFAPAAAEAGMRVVVADSSVYVSDSDTTVNTVTITHTEGKVTIRDTSTPPFVDPDTTACMPPTPDDPNTVVCTVANPILESVYGDAGDDTITLVGIAGKMVQGNDGADTLNGGELGDVLDGGEGNDTIRGNGGADQLIGRAGADRLEARDGIVDVGVDCGEDAGDVSVTDTSDPHSAGCETDERGEFTTGGGDGGSGGGTPTTPTTDGGGTPTTDSEVIDTKRTITVPNFAPYQKKGKWRFHARDTVVKRLKELKIPYRVVFERKTLRSVSAKFRSEVDDEDVIAQGRSPKPGEELVIDTACTDRTADGCRLNLRVSIYDEAKELGSRSCPYQDKKLWRNVEGQSYEAAGRILKELGCRYRIVNYIEGSADLGERIADAQFSKTKNVFFINLVVERPKRSDFTVSIAPRPYAEIADPANADRRDDFAHEIDLGVDGKLTSAKNNRGVLTVIVNENFSARFVRSVKIEVVKHPAGHPEQSKAIASSETGDAGAVTFPVAVDWVGDLEVNVRVRAKRSKDDLAEETMQGWTTIPVVKRAAGALVQTISGRAFRLRSGRYEPVDVAAEVAAAQAAVAKPLADAIGALRSLLPPANGCQSQGANPHPLQFLAICWQSGASATDTSNGGSTAVGGVAQTGYTQGLLVTPRGVTQTRVDGVVVPGSGSVPGLSYDNRLALVNTGWLQGGTADAASGKTTLLNGTTLIGTDGGTLIGTDGGTLIGTDGGTLIGTDGGTLISDKGGAGFLPLG